MNLKMHFDPLHYTQILAELDVYFRPTDLRHTKRLSFYIKTIANMRQKPQNVGNISSDDYTMWDFRVIFIVIYKATKT